MLNILFRNLFKFRRKVYNHWSIHHKLNYCQEYKKNVIKILFFGTDNFSLPSLKLLNEEYKKKDRIDVLEVMTSFKAAKNPVKSYANTEGLITYDWQEHKSFPKKYDIGLIVSFGHLIPEDMISSFPLGMLNVHASMLPKLRGAAPIIYAIKEGLTETGVSIMKIKPKYFDIGEILTQRKIAIDPHVLMPDLHNKLAVLGAEALVDCVLNLNQYLPLLSQQDNKLASFAPKIDQTFTEIRWKEMSAKQVYDLFRSLYSFKNVKTKWNDEVIKFHELKLIDDATSSTTELRTPGFVEYSKKYKALTVVCADQKAILVHRISLGKKKIMSAADFNNGFLKKISNDKRYFL